MSNEPSWFTSNISLIFAIPVLVAGVAVSQTTLEGTAQDAAFLTLVVALLVCVFLVARNARTSRR